MVRATKVPIPLVIAKNKKENQKINANALSILEKIEVVFCSSLVLFCFRGSVALIVTPNERKREATVMIRKVTNSNPAFKKKIKLKIIQMGDNVKIEVICLFLRFFY